MGARLKAVHNERLFSSLTGDESCKLSLIGSDIEDADWSDIRRPITEKAIDDGAFTSAGRLAGRANSLRILRGLDEGIKQGPLLLRKRNRAKGNRAAGANRSQWAGIFESKKTQVHTGWRAKVPSVRPTHDIAR